MDNAQHIHAEREVFVIYPASQIFQILPSGQRKRLLVDAKDKPKPPLDDAKIRRILIHHIKE